MIAIEILWVLNERPHTREELGLECGINSSDLDVCIEALEGRGLVGRGSGEDKEAYLISEAGLRVLREWSEIWRKSSHGNP